MREGIIPALVSAAFLTSCATITNSKPLQRARIENAFLAFIVEGENDFYRTGQCMSGIERSLTTPSYGDLFTIQEGKTIKDYFDDYGLTRAQRYHFHASRHLACAEIQSEYESARRRVLRQLQMRQRLTGSGERSTIQEVE